MFLKLLNNIQKNKNDLRKRQLLSEGLKDNLFHRNNLKYNLENLSLKNLKSR